MKGILIIIGVMFILTSNPGHKLILTYSILIALVLLLFLIFWLIEKSSVFYPNSFAGYKDDVILPKLIASIWYLFITITIALIVLGMAHFFLN